MTANEKRPVALITGITGQDGSYLAEFLLKRGYEVHGIKRRSSSFNTERIDHLYQDPHEECVHLHLHYGDMTDSSNLISLIQKIRPDEIYNLAAQSHVQVSFETPEYTADVNALGTLRLLEAIRICGLEKTCRFYQASTSELYGKVVETPQKESTPFYPRSPYAVSKLFAYWMVVNYREAYGIYACNGILFNHESPKRGETFVTRKITRAVSRISLGLQDTLYLGNLNATRDWGFAGDYVELMWLMLQQDNPKDYVMATGVTTSVREFVRSSFEQVGMTVRFEGTGLDEIAVCEKTGKVVLRIDPRYFRPTEVEALLGDATQAKTELGWEPKIGLDELSKMMIEHDLEEAKRSVHILEGGFKDVCHEGE